MATGKTVDKTAKNTKAVKPVEESESALDRDAQLEEQELIADVIDILPDPKRLRIKEQNKLTKMTLALMPIYDELYERDEDGELVRTDEGVKVRQDDVDQTVVAEAMMQIAESVDAFCEDVALDKDKYVEWAEGKNISHFQALFSYFRASAGE